MPGILKISDTIELQIDRMTFGPAAVGRLPLPGAERPIVVFVQGAVPGERVRAKLTKNNKNYWDAELVEVLHTSSKRATPPCPVFGRCGGCQWQHLDYAAQVEAKQEILIHQLDRATRLGEDQLRSLLNTHAAASPLGYRARVQVHGDKKGLGYFAAGSHKIIHTDSCPITHPDIQAAWSEFTRKRPMAELAKATGQFKVEWTRSDSGQVLEAINRKHGAHGFTQVNPEQNFVLRKVVAELAGGGSLLLDLYGGNGNLSDLLINRFKHAVSVDSYNDGRDPTGIETPLAEGRLFIREKSEDFLLNQRLRDWGFTQIDCAIADPPRDGMRTAAGRLAALSAQRIILVSCDPSTLSRDLVSFTSAGYAVGAIHLIDMFPQTYHLETVVLLEKQKGR